MQAMSDMDRLLAGWVERDGMPEDEARLIATQILSENARAVYGLGEEEAR